MNKTKLISAIAASAMLITAVPQLTYAEDEEASVVYVTVENYNLSEDDGAPWTGAKIEDYAVTLTEGMTAAKATEAALTANGYTGEGLASGWVTELAGLSAAATETGAWMMSVNDYFGSYACNQYILNEGDEVVWEYSASYGSDLGIDYMNADTSLKSIELEGATISTAFDGETTDYYITLDEGCDEISVVPAMKNRYFQSRIYKNLTGTDYENGEQYRYGEKLTAAVGDVITVACGVKGWDNGFYYQTEQTADEHIYTLTVCASSDYTVTAPTESTVGVFSQIKNYNTVEIMPAVETDNGDGTKTVLYALPSKMKNFTYRVSEENKITKAGYIKSGDSGVSIEFGENEDPKTRPQYDTTTSMGKYAEDNMLLNINAQNYLRLSVGDEFKVRAFRAWQIVNNTVSNIMIEPDFDFKIISGDSIELDTDKNTATVKAVKSGVSIVEVTYDAIEIGGNTALGGVYGAVDPSRKGLFIVNVDGDTSEAITMPDWDTEFDTVYFTGESGTYDFAPTAEKDIIVTCNGENIAKNENGTYTLTINEGNNIVTAECGDTVEYTVIKGGKVTIKDTENGFKTEGLHMPIPKMGGVYNPGYKSTVKTVYGDLTSKGAQYDFINNNEITVTETGTLSGGVISVVNMGYEKGAHRTITDEGLGANLNPAECKYTFSSLPDVWVSAGNDIFTASYDAEGILSKVSKYNHVIENDGADKVFVWNGMQPVLGR